MDVPSLKYWLVVIDHLMTHDKSSFKELLARISTTQNSTLTSLITSKDQEYEMRSNSLKRLAFVLLSSEMDQYHTQLPEIQERLTENLRLYQVPHVHAQVFLCYRVLLLRLSPQYLVSMWPSMVTELVQVLLQVEQELTGPVVNTGEHELKCARDDQWLQLYLSACKLLETLCTLPSGRLPQFQMCHWAFVTSTSATNSDAFVPHCSRICQLLRTKYGKLSMNDRKTTSSSLVTVKHLSTFAELRPFFGALATQSKRSQQNQADERFVDAELLTGVLDFASAKRRLEHSLHVDFCENWQL
uniref:DOP1-like C-terminal domain-containing protein n=1 Tax=Plectus sambesii TaxID=2011161 RepID=A0A914WXF9_9BILA